MTRGAAQAEISTHALAAGGAIVEPMRWVEIGANRMRIGFFPDTEGFVLEIMER